MAKKTFYTDCTAARAADIDAMMDKAREVKFETIVKHIEGGEKTLNDMFGHHPKVKDDYSVRFYTSTYKGKKCAIVKHSAIEYIFV